MSIQQQDLLQVRKCCAVMRRFRQEHNHAAQVHILKEIIKEVDYGLCIFLEENGAKSLCSHLEVIKTGLEQMHTEHV